MQTIRRHKILASFNILALLLIIFGKATDFTVPESGTSISGTIAAWGSLLLVVILIVDGVVAARQSGKSKISQQTGIVTPPSPHQSKMAKLNGISIILGALLGLATTILILAPQGGDAGLLLIPLAAILAPLGAFILFTVSKVTFGEQKDRKSALKLFFIVALLIAAYLGYSYYQDKYGQKYCDGQPVEQYQGPLPTYCQNQ